jgi:formate hydrogenlyase subunit 4
MTIVANLLALMVMPLMLVGVINRVKAWWSGRKGAPILQPAWDVVRLLRKTSVYGVGTTPIFRITPWVSLVASLGAAAVVPLLGVAPIASFPFDFVWLAYAWGLGRVATMLGALDTGSSFEGMGASREATFSTILEPALFLSVGALSLASGSHTVHEALTLHPRGGVGVFVWGAALLVSTIALQVEAARMPVDDPTTHLELTMVHEVMVLDHGGPELAAIQAGSAVKLYASTAFVATLLNPLAGRGAEPWAFTALVAAANVGLSILVAVFIGTVESLVARLRLRTVPQYIAVGLTGAALALLATTWRVGGAR